MKGRQKEREKNRLKNETIQKGKARKNKGKGIIEEALIEERNLTEKEKI